MDIDEISQAASRAMTLAVLRKVEDLVKSQQPDTSACAPEHVIGYEAGFRACKRAILEGMAD